MGNRGDSRGNQIPRGLLHGSEARSHPTGNDHCVAAATAAGSTRNPEITGKPEVTGFENESGNFNFPQFVTSANEANEESDSSWEVRYAHVKSFLEAQNQEEDTAEKAPKE